MAVEDFSTYTELDGSSRIAVTESRITWASLTMGEDAWVYKDKTAGFFGGDFTHLLTVMMTAGNKQDARTYCWCLTNAVDDTYGIDAGGGSYLGLFLYRGATTYSIYLEECDSGTLHQDTYAINLDRSYYLKIVRDESVDYGTLYCYVYSDSARTTLIDTLTLTLSSSKKDFQYIFGVNTRNISDASYNTSGYSENLDLIGGSSSGGTATVTTQACTDTIAESSTGNGTLLSIGTSAVTAHGHCWGTSSNPTIGSDSYKDNGAAPNPTHFTSAITGLTPGTLYYVRAFATNTSGTAYGANVQIAGDVTTIGRRYWSVQGEDFTWFGESGTRRKAQGVTMASDANILIYL